MGSSSNKHSSGKRSKRDGKQAGDSHANYNEDPNEAYNPSTEGNWDTAATASFTSIEVSNGHSEPETLTQEVVDERKEMRRKPTSDFADGSCDKMLRRSDTNPYTNEAPYSSSSKKKSSGEKKKKNK